MKIRNMLTEVCDTYTLYRYYFVDAQLSEIVDSFINDIKKQLNAELKGINISYKNGRNHTPNYNIKITEFILNKDVYGCHVLYYPSEKTIVLYAFIYD